MTQAMSSFCIMHTIFAHICKSIAVAVFRFFYAVLCEQGLYMTLHVKFFFIFGRVGFPKVSHVA